MPGLLGVGSVCTHTSPGTIQVVGVTGLPVCIATPAPARMPGPRTPPGWHEAWGTRPGSGLRHQHEVRGGRPTGRQRGPDRPGHSDVCREAPACPPGEQGHPTPGVQEAGGLGSSPAAPSAERAPPGGSRRPRPLRRGPAPSKAQLLPRRPRGARSKRQAPGLPALHPCPRPPGAATPLQLPCGSGASRRPGSPHHVGPALRHVPPKTDPRDAVTRVRHCWVQRLQRWGLACAAGKLPEHLLSPRMSLVLVRDDPTLLMSPVRVQGRLGSWVPTRPTPGLCTSSSKPRVTPAPACHPSLPDSPGDRDPTNDVGTPPPAHTTHTPCSHHMAPLVTTHPSSAHTTLLLCSRYASPLLTPCPACSHHTPPLLIQHLSSAHTTPLLCSYHTPPAHTTLRDLTDPLDGLPSRTHISHALASKTP